MRLLWLCSVVVWRLLFGWVELVVVVNVSFVAVIAQVVVAVEQLVVLVQELA